MGEVGRVHVLDKLNKYPTIERWRLEGLIMKWFIEEIIKSYKDFFEPLSDWRFWIMFIIIWSLFLYFREANII